MNRRDFIKTAAVAAGCAAGLPIAAEASRSVIESAAPCMKIYGWLDPTFREGSLIQIVNANGGNKSYNGIYRVASIDPNRRSFTVSL